MKKNITVTLLALLLLSGYSNVKAEESSTNDTSSANLNIKFNELESNGVYANEKNGDNITYGQCMGKYTISIDDITIKSESKRTLDEYKNNYEFKSYEQNVYTKTKTEFKYYNTATAATNSESSEHLSNRILYNSGLIDNIGSEDIYVVTVEDATNNASYSQCNRIGYMQVLSASDFNAKFGAGKEVNISAPITNGCNAVLKLRIYSKNAKTTFPGTATQIENKSYRDCFSSLLTSLPMDIGDTYETKGNTASTTTSKDTSETAIILSNIEKKQAAEARRIEINKNIDWISGLWSNFMDNLIKLGQTICDLIINRSSDSAMGIRNTSSYNTKTLSSDAAPEVSATKDSSSSNTSNNTYAKAEAVYYISGFESIKGKNIQDAVDTINNQSNNKNLALASYFEDCIDAKEVVAYDAKYLNDTISTTSSGKRDEIVESIESVKDGDPYQLIISSPKNTPIGEAIVVGVNEYFYNNAIKQSDGNYKIYLTYNMLVNNDKYIYVADVDANGNIIATDLRTYAKKIANGTYFIDSKLDKEGGLNSTDSITIDNTSETE